MTFSWLEISDCYTLLNWYVYCLLLVCYAYLHISSSSLHPPCVRFEVVKWNYPCFHSANCSAETLSFRWSTDLFEFGLFSLGLIRTLLKPLFNNWFNSIITWSKWLNLNVFWQQHFYLFIFLYLCVMHHNVSSSYGFETLSTTN